MADDSMAGKWKLDHNENFEEFLEEMGAPWIARKAAGRSKSTQEIIINGDHVTIKLSSKLTSRVMEFTVGQEFESDWSGNKSKAMAKWEDGKLVMTEVGQAGTTTTTRYVDGEGTLMMIMTSPKGLVCKRYFKKST